MSSADATPFSYCNGLVKRAMLLLVLTLALAATTSAMPPTLDGWDLDSYHNFMPAPNDAALSNGSFTIGVDPALTVTINVTSPILAAAAERFTATTFAWPGASSSSDQALVRLEVEVGDTDESAPQLGMDESYSLEVPATMNGTALLRANAVWGALRGLETLLQLIEFEPADGCYLVRYAPWRITDSPQLPHRGLMIDTARHFLPVEAIKRQIEAAAATKFNTIHWHAVDSDAFPLELESFPKLAELGSYSIGAFRMTYTVQQQQDIVEFARLRGVRIVLELDLPGHADAWALGAPPGAFTECVDPGDLNQNRAYLDVTSTEAYAFYDQLLTEITSRFPDRVIHLGGDEVSTNCWNASITVQAWLQAHPDVALEELYPRHMLRAYLLANKHNRVGQAWGPSLSAALNYSTNGTGPVHHASGVLPLASIDHLWSSADIGPTLASGRSAVVSMGYYFAPHTISGTQAVWEAVYARDPACWDVNSSSSCLWNIPAEQHHLFLGVEACAWGEATDNFNIDQLLWFRLAALSERMWMTNANIAARGIDLASISYNTRDVVARLVKHRCRLLQRGIAAEGYSAGQASRSKWQQCQGWLPQLL